MISQRKSKTSSRSASSMCSERWETTSLQLCSECLINRQKLIPIGQPTMRPDRKNIKIHKAALTKVSSPNKSKSSDLSSWQRSEDQRRRRTRQLAWSWTTWFNNVWTTEQKGPGMTRARAPWKMKRAKTPTLILFLYENQRHIRVLDIVRAQVAPDVRAKREWSNSTQ